jgi:hypothetical protein
VRARIEIFPKFSAFRFGAMDLDFDESGVFF